MKFIKRKLGDKYMSYKSDYFSTRSNAQLSKIVVGTGNPYHIRSSSLNTNSNFDSDVSGPFDRSDIHTEPRIGYRVHSGTWSHCMVCKDGYAHYFNPLSYIAIDIKSITGISDNKIVDLVCIHDDNTEMNHLGAIMLDSYQKIYIVGDRDQFRGYSPSQAYNNDYRATRQIPIPEPITDIASGVINCTALSRTSNIYFIGAYLRSRFTGRYPQNLTNVSNEICFVQNPFASSGRYIVKLMDPINPLDCGIGCILNDGSYWIVNGIDTPVEPFPNFKDIIKVETVIHPSLFIRYAQKQVSDPITYILRANGEVYLYRPNGDAFSPNGATSLRLTGVKDIFAAQDGIIYTKGDNIWKTYGGILFRDKNFKYMMPEFLDSINNTDISNDPVEVSGTMYTIPVNDTNFKEPTEYIYSQLTYNSLTRLRHKHYYNDTFTSTSENTSRNFYIKTTLSVSDTQISGQGIDSRVTRNVVNYVCSYIIII